jgi:hypothetical protein
MGKNKELSEREYAAELVRLVDGFKEKLQMGTSDADNFLTISEIEQLWSELRGNTSELYSDMIHELLSSADESDLIRKKNGIQTKRNHFANKQKISPINLNYQWFYPFFSLCA